MSLRAKDKARTGLFTIESQGKRTLSGYAGGITSLTDEEWPMALWLAAFECPDALGYQNGIKRQDEAREHVHGDDGAERLRD